MALSVRLADSIPMFQVDASRSAVIMFFRFDDTCDVVAVYDTVTCDLRDSQNSSSFNVLEMSDSIEEHCDVLLPIILAYSRVLLAAVDAMLRELSSIQRFRS